MGSALNHLFHGFVCGLVVFALLRWVLGQSESKATTNAVFVGLVVSLYMVMFGHGPPGRLNSHLF